MNLRKIPLVFAVATAAGLLAGCASHTAGRNNHTVLLGGLYESQEGAYSPEPANTLPLNGEKPLPGSRLTGRKVSILWGLVSYRDQ